MYYALLFLFMPFVKPYETADERKAILYQGTQYIVWLIKSPLVAMLAFILMRLIDPSPQSSFLIITIILVVVGSVLIMEYLLHSVLTINRSVIDSLERYHIQDNVERIAHQKTSLYIFLLIGSGLFSFTWYMTILWYGGFMILSKD